MSKRPAKHSLTLRGHRTSVTLEDDFWHALNEIAEDKSLPMNELVAQIDEARGRNDIGLASAIRVFILNHYRAKSDKTPQ